MGNTEHIRLSEVCVMYTYNLTKLVQSNISNTMEQVVYKMHGYKVVQN